MLVMLITSKDTSTYFVMYGRTKLAELEDPETTSVVVGEEVPPNNITFPSSPGRLQQRCNLLSSLSVREGREETSEPLTFSHDLSDDDVLPPQMRPPQLEWRYLSCCRSWTVQELPLEGLYSSSFL